MKIFYLQNWADWPSQAGSKKCAAKLIVCRCQRKLPISQKLAELPFKKLTFELLNLLNCSLFDCDFTWGCECE